MVLDISTSGIIEWLTNKKVTKLVFAWGGYKFTVDDKYFSYQSAYAKSFRVVKSDIESVSLDEAGWGKYRIKVNGTGMVLASVIQPKGWAEKVQDFVFDEIISKKEKHEKM